MDTITPLSAIARVNSSTSQGQGHNQQQSSGSQGQFLKALVLEAGGNDRFVLEIRGNRQAVRSEAPLSPGQTLRLQVVKTTPQIELQIVSNPINQLQGRSLTLLGKNIDLSVLFEGIHQQSSPPLDSINITSRSSLENFYSLQQSGIEGKNGGTILKSLIDNLGLNLEQLLAKGETGKANRTLKAALLDIAHNFRNATSIAETTNNILATLELFQLTQLQSANDTQLIFPIPLPFIEQGYLLVERDDEDSSTNDGTVTERRFSLHLTVSDLGDLQIDFLQNPEGLFIRFRAGNREKADFIESFATELKEAITDLPLISLTFSGDAPDPIQDLIRQFVPEDSSMLDTKV